MNDPTTNAEANPGDSYEALQDDGFPPIELVPLRGQLYRRSIRNGDSTSHIDRLIDISPFKGDCPYLICVGRTSSGSNHCWLETDQVVVDLTDHQRFFQRVFYYETNPGIVAGTVRRFTFPEIERLIEIDPRLSSLGEID